MTPEILQYLQQMSHVIGKNRNVLEIGSMDVNGSARSVIHHEKWLGVDIAKGKNVDVVLPEDDISYDSVLMEKMFYPDTLVICECLEHAKFPTEIVAAGEYALWMTRQVQDNDVKRRQRYYDTEKQLIVITSPSYHFPYHAYPKDYWRFSKDTFEDVFFEGMDIFDIRYLDSNEGAKTTIAGIASLRP